MKIILLSIFCMLGYILKAQKVDSLYVNLYTDSLKKGTFNYINIDGLMSTCNYLPLDSTQISFYSNGGTFSGNSLFIASDFSGEKVHIKIVSKANSKLCKEWDMYVKKEEDAPLKTADQLINEMRKKRN